MSKTLKINIPEVDGDIVISVRAIKPLHPIIKQEAIISDVANSVAYKTYTKFFKKVNISDGIVIPGLKSNMIVQGMCKGGNYIFVSAYDYTKTEYSCVYMINASSKLLERTLWIKGSFNHVGGLASDDTYLYITCSPKVAIIKLSTLSKAVSGTDIEPTLLTVKNDKGSKFTCSFCNYDTILYKQTMKNRWNPYTNEPIKTASELCYALRRIVNEDESRAIELLRILEGEEKAIIFYNFDYELDILKNLTYIPETVVAEWNGHAHQPIPDSERWVYLVQYTAGCEGWNCTKTDTIIFYSQNYSYKVLKQAIGRIDRINTVYKDLYYYHMKSKSSIDLAIGKAIKNKKKFNETGWLNS